MKCWIWRLGVYFLTAVWCVTTVQAENTRMRNLINSEMMARELAIGIWAVDTFDNQIHYRCLQCDGVVTAKMEVQAIHQSGTFPALAAGYLAERRQLCSDLAAGRLGQCVGTREISARHALQGFRSETLHLSHREIEIVLFYHDPYWLGPEQIRTIIRISSGASLPVGSEDMFSHHMARLTIFW